MLAKSKLNTTEVLIYRALIASNIGHNSFFLKKKKSDKTILKKKFKIQRHK